MRRIVLYGLMSPDGVAEEPGNWMCDVDRATTGAVFLRYARTR